MEVLISAQQIHARVNEMAREIALDYADDDVTFVGVLTGSLMFLADLVRQLDLRLRIGFVQASSYRGASTTAGSLHIGPELLPDVRNRHVLLLDDILDTGKTLQHLVAHIKGLGPRSVKVAVLLRKRGRQEVEFEPDYCGFEIPDRFVVGYGMDFNDEHRHLPYIGVINDS